MNKVLIIMLSICYYSTNGQDFIPSKVVKTERQKNIFVDSNFITNGNSAKIDTIKLDLKSKEELAIPINSDNLTKVVMIKEESKFDFLKYLFPIITLILGIFIKEFLDKKSNKEKIKKSGERWVAELRSLEEPLKKQIEELENFLKEHEKEEFLTPRITLFSSLNGELFKSLDKNELIKYIEMKNKKSEFKDIIKISNRTHGYISILVHLHQTYKDKFEKFIVNSSLHFDVLTKSLQAFNIGFADYAVDIKTEIKSNPYGDERYKPLADLYSAQIAPHLEDGKFNPFKLRKDFFDPILSIISKLQINPRVKPLLNSTSEALNSIKALKMEKEYLTQNTNIIIAHYQKLLAELSSIVSNIERSQP